MALVRWSPVGQLAGMRRWSDPAGVELLNLLGIGEEVRELVGEE